MPNYTILVCVHNQNGSKTIYEAVEPLGSGVDSCVYKLGNQTYSSIQYYCKVNQPQSSKENKYLVFHSYQPIPSNSVIKIINPVKGRKTGIANSHQYKSDDILPPASRTKLIASTQTKFRLQQEINKFLQYILQEQYEKELAAMDREANLTRHCSNGVNSGHTYIQTLKSAPSIKHKITDNSTINYLIELNIAMIMPYIKGTPLFSGSRHTKVSLEKYLAISMASLEEINRLHYKRNTIHGDIHGNNILVQADISQAGAVKAYAIDVAKAVFVGESFYKYHLTCSQKHRYTTSDRQTYELDQANKPVPAKFRHDLFALTTTFLDFFLPRVDRTGSITTSIDLSGNNTVKRALNKVIFKFLKVQLQNLAELYDDPVRDFNDFRPIQQLLITAWFLLINMKHPKEIDHLNSSLQSPWIMDYLSYTLIGPNSNLDPNRLRATLDCFTLFPTKQLEQLNNFYIKSYQIVYHRRPRVDFLSQCFQPIQQIYKQEPKAAQLLAQSFVRIENFLKLLRSLELEELCSSANSASITREKISNLYTCCEQVIVTLPMNIIDYNIGNIDDALEKISQDIKKVEQSIQAEIKHRTEDESPDAIPFFNNIDQLPESLVPNAHLITGSLESFYQQNKTTKTACNALATKEPMRNFP